VRYEAISIMSEEVCAFKTQECNCNIKSCLCNIKRNICITKEKDNFLISKVSVQKTFKSIKSFLTKPPTYSYDKERLKRELHEAEMAAEIHRKIF